MRIIILTENFLGQYYYIHLAIFTLSIIMWSCLVLNIPAVINICVYIYILYLRHHGQYALCKCIGAPRVCTLVLFILIHVIFFIYFFLIRALAWLA